MPPLPRATCPVCHGDIALRTGGELREHPDHRHELYSVPGAVRDGRVPNCPGSGSTAAGPCRSHVTNSRTGRVEYCEQGDEGHYGTCIGSRTEDQFVALGGRL